MDHTIVSSASRTRSNDDWIADLRSGGSARDAAVDDLRAYLLRAILIYLTHHRSDLGGVHPDELRQLAEDWAQEATIQVLANLERFRGDSKLTTWAYRVAINLVAGELRRKRWENSSLEALTESESPDVKLKTDDGADAPELRVTRALVWDAIRKAIDADLSERQRVVLTRVILEGRSIEDTALELETNRNNIYKLVHDARKKLRGAMEQRGWSASDVLAAFTASEREG